MKLTTVAIALVLISVWPAWAAWISLGGDETVGMTIYIDPSTIQKSGDRRTVWVLYDFQRDQQKEGGISFRSAKVQREYDCAKAVTRILMIHHFAGPMESGKKVLEKTVAGQEWEPVGRLESGTVAKDLWTLTCEE
ncbi:MAG: hypothetical protein NNA20_11150 [Nitrospira sp.]|nr:hypothetical protein [Nitrospira sp.]MCP9443138.1 hypothetical protein [Nitrospira sp.]